LKDPTGHVLPSVSIALVGVAGGIRIQGQTDELGGVTFTGMASGDYEIEVRKPGFSSRQGRVTLISGRKIERNLVLQLASVAEMVVVLAKPGGHAGPQRLPNSQPAVDPCNGSTVPGCVTSPTKLVDARPQYPGSQAANGVSGQVKVEATIGRNGRLKDLRPGTGSEQAFAQAAVEALRLWRFSPARVNGIPVECRITVIAVFDARRQ
jgi:TonB family protein